MKSYGSQLVTTPDGAKLWTSTSGQGEPAIVLADGLGCDGFIWKYLAPKLAERHRVIRFNYRGHGQSGLPRDPSRLSISHFADDLAQIMDELEVPSAVIAGHSMGVQVLFEFHRRHPGRVLGLIPVCGSYGNAIETFHDDTVLQTVFPVLREVVERFPVLVRGIWKRVLPTELAVWIARNFESRPDLLSRADFWPYLRHMTAMDPLTFVRTLDAAGRHSAWPHLPRVDVPTLILTAERDRFTPMWLSERMHMAIPHSELVVIPTASHCAPLEMPQLVELAIERFIREKVQAAQPIASVAASSDGSR